MQCFSFTRHFGAIGHAKKNIGLLSSTSNVLYAPLDEQKRAIGASCSLRKAMLLVICFSSFYDP